MAQKEQQTPIAIQMHNQYIKDMSLEVPFAPEIFQEIKSQPNVKVDVKVGFSDLENNFYNVEMIFRIDSEVNDKKLFIVELTYAGVVSLNIPEEHIEPVLLIEIPHLLFPFARQIITTSLANAGLPPLMINPIDFSAMYQARKQQETAESVN